MSIMSQDLTDGRKAAAVVSQLQGAAAELAAEILAQVLLADGQMNSVATEPLTFVMHQLAENHGELGEETRLQNHY